MSLKAFALLQFNNDNGLDLCYFMSADESLCKGMNMKSSSVRTDFQNTLRTLDFSSNKKTCIRVLTLTKSVKLL